MQAENNVATLIVPGLCQEFLPEHLELENLDLLVPPPPHSFFLPDYSYSDLLYLKKFPNWEFSQVSLAESLGLQKGLAGKFYLVEPVNLKLINNQLLLLEPEILQLNERLVLSVIEFLNLNNPDNNFYYLQNELWLLRVKETEQFPKASEIKPSVDLGGEDFFSIIKSLPPFFVLKLNEWQMLLNTFFARTDEVFQKSLHNQMVSFSYALDNLRINALWLWDKGNKKVLQQAKNILAVSFLLPKIYNPVYQEEEVYLQELANFNKKLPFILKEIKASGFAPEQRGLRLLTTTLGGKLVGINCEIKDLPQLQGGFWRKRKIKLKRGSFYHLNQEIIRKFY